MPKRDDFNETELSSTPTPPARPPRAEKVIELPPVEVTEFKKAEALEPFEKIAARLGTEAWLVASVKAYHSWGEGREVTESDFKAACQKTLGIQLNPM